jgi:hypothetical protein
VARLTVMRARTRAAVRWIVGLVVAVGVVVGWSATAGADDDPDDEVTAEVECLKSVEQMMPGSVGSYVGEQLIPGYNNVQSARRTAWILTSIGISIPNWANDLLGNTTTVEARGPRWYVEEAVTEAEDYDNCALAWWRPVGDCRRPMDPTGEQGPGGDGEDPAEPDAPGRNGITRFLPDKCWGPYPADSYDLHYDAGNMLQMWQRKLWAGMTGFFHHVGKGAMQVALGLLGFAFTTFQVLDYKDVALTAATQYQDHLVGPFGLVDMAWLVLVGFVAVKALRGRLGVAGGEIVMSLLMLTLASTLMANREGYLQGAATNMDQLTSSILAAGSGEDPADASGDAYWYVRPVQKALFVEFIDRPYDYINFGGEITEDTCIKRRNRILYAGAPNDGGWGIRYMDGRDEDDTTCDAHALAMGAPTGERMLIAFTTMAVCIGVALIVAGAALTMLIAKVLLLVLFALAPFAAAAAPLPGVGRRLAWGWVGIFVQAMTAAVGMGFVLSLFLLGVQVVVDQTDEMAPFERWVVMLLIVGVLYLVRLRILGASKAVATAVADNLTRLSPAAAHWQGGPGIGLDLRGADRRVARGTKAVAGYGVQQAPLQGIAAAGAVVGLGATAWNRRRTGRIGLRNLRRMERYREDVGHAMGLRGMPFNPRRRRRALRRMEHGSGGRGPGPSWPRGGGAGSGPGWTRGVGRPRSEPVSVGPTRGHPRTPRPRDSAEPRPPVGNWLAARGELARDTMRLDRAAEVAGSVGRGTTRGVARAWRGTRDAIGGRLSPRLSHLERRWRDRQPANRYPGYWADRGDDRRGIDRRYQERRAAEREAAADLAPGRRRLRPDERQQLGFETSPRGARRRDYKGFRERWAHPESVRLRDYPGVRHLRSLGRRIPGFGRRSRGHDRGRG